MPPVQHRHFFLATCGPVQHRQFLLATCKEHVATNATPSPNRIVLLLIPLISLSREKPPSCCAALHSNCSLTTPTHFFLQILTSRFLCPLQINFFPRIDSPFFKSTVFIFFKQYVINFHIEFRVITPSALRYNYRLSKICSC